MLDFISEHKKLVIILGVILLIVIVMFGIRNHNIKKKAEAEEQARIEAEAEAEKQTQQVVLKEEGIDEAPQSEYRRSLGIDADKGDGRVDVGDINGNVQNEKEVKQKDPTYEVSVKVFDHTSVPTKMVDGSDIIAYLNSVSLENFGSNWGSPLTEEDFKGGLRYLVGVKQNPEDYIKSSDLQSVGWLINNIGGINNNDAIKFTNLHCVGSLSDDHSALLCCYDWYSAFGIKDTLVVFEDISGTVPVETINAGDIFSCTVFRHNVKLERVNNQNVVCIQYTTY